MRNFPVPLSDIDGCDASVHLVVEPDQGAWQEEGTLTKPVLDDLVPEASVGVSRCSEVIEVQGSSQSSDRCNYLLFHGNCFHNSNFVLSF
jgi:hypothetical protein